MLSLSTHWMLDKQDLYMKRKRDLSVLTEEEYGKIMILFANCESSLYDLDPGIYGISHRARDTIHSCSMNE